MMAFPKGTKCDSCDKVFTEFDEIHVLEMATKGKKFVRDDPANTFIPICQVCLDTQVTHREPGETRAPN